MAQINDANSSRCSTPASRGFDSFPSRAATPEYVDVGGRQDYTGGPRTGLKPEASFQSTASGSSYEERDQHHDQPFPQHYWSTVGRSGQSRNSGIITRENSGSTATSEESAVDPALAYYPLNRWGGGYRPGPYAHPAFWNVQAPYQPVTDPARAGMVQAYPYPQYRLPRVHPNHYANRGVGVTSHLVPPFNPYAMPPKNPPGGPSSAAANAETNPTVAEKEAPTYSPSPRANLRKWRVRYGRDLEKLCAWAKKREESKRGPTHLKALQTALEVVQAFRPVPVYPSSKLKKGSLNGHTQNVRSRAATAEARRREGIRAVNDELSKYYELPGDRTEWECPELLSKVLQDIESLEEPPQSA